MQEESITLLLDQRRLSCLNKLHVVIKSLRATELSLRLGQTALDFKP